MGLIVQKFGGTSLSDAAKIHRAAKRAIQAKLEGNSVVMVVSARGKTTDELEKMAYEITDNPSKREMDQLLSTGEQISISLMAMAIQSVGHEAVSFTGGQVGLITDKAHTKARIQRIDAERITSQLDQGKIVIVAGFQGIDENANITTLGRGGSDTTAVALAAMLRADCCDIFTDVPGVFTADPRIVPTAQKLQQISYDEMLELASLGAGVMHSRAVEFGKKYNVLIRVRPSASDELGTEICQEVDGMEEIVVSGVSLKKDVAQITMDHVPDTPGIAADIFAQIAQANVIVDDIIQTEHSSG
ncbi:MAG: aspartate kinase, partial [Actinobacteria bacterium]|nr:aspartate kinase [Actinomycetota bacterium]